MTIATNRRNLLRAVGVSSAAQLFPSLRRADAAEIPTRVVFFFTFQGTLRDIWAPTGTETSFTLGDLHKPLEPYKSDLIVLDGVDMTSSYADPIDGSNAHYAGITHALTAVSRASPTAAGGISIDQFIAQGLAEQGRKTPLPWLGAAVTWDYNAGNYFTGGEGGISWSGPNKVVPYDSDFLRIYNRLFPDGAVPASMNGPDPTAVRLAQQRRAIDLALGEMKAMETKLSGEDRMKLRSHVSNLADVQSRMMALPVGSTFGCKPLAKGDIERAYNARGQGDGPQWKARGELMPKMVAAALACDRTRVISVGIEEIGALAGYVPGSFGSSDFHALVHDTATGGKNQNNPDARAPVKAYHLLLADRFAALLQALRDVRESDGKTLLDHTVVLWCGQIGEGNHDLRRMPYILAGGAGGYFRTGRYLKVSRPGDRGQPHNNLFVSLANAAGLDTTTFGQASVCTGPLAGLR